MRPLRVLLVLLVCANCVQAWFKKSPKVEKKQPPFCTKPPFLGSCRPLTQTWYYNSTEKRCTPSNVGSCIGGTNRFVSENKCKETCESPSKATPSNTMCLKPPVTVSCGQVEHAWFFDPNTSTCKMFTYIASACGSVSNKFWTEMMCQAVCLRKCHSY
ncbi:kunitz-type serine protease inhibitor B5-like [Dermacentor variabilis]|uniref:kunitz-type serine protease inhibitor B5-like n=1 Tax=Dermacentor variabilis TaxID=34621 RepID=UPI003F5C861A